VRGGRRGVGWVRIVSWVVDRQQRSDLALGGDAARDEVRRLDASKATAFYGTCRHPGRLYSLWDAAS
jgi:hypothetical protein